SVFLVPGGAVFDKVMSNLEEVRARRGPIIAVTSDADPEIADTVSAKADEVVFVPDVPEYLQPVVAAVPLQLLAYHIGLLRGLGVDAPPDVEVWREELMAEKRPAPPAALPRNDWQDIEKLLDKRLGLADQGLTLLRGHLIDGRAGDALLTLDEVAAELALLRDR